jgi:preprotein translocase subunit YajC
MMSAAILLQASGAQGGGLGSILFLVLPMILIMYFMVFRPQQQQRKRAQEMQGALKTGDKVITGSGIYGTVSGLDGDSIILKISSEPQVKIRIARAAIAQVETAQDAK